MFLTIDDFNQGKYELGRGSYDTTRIQDYINKYEARYLTLMLGATLYAEFKADVILGGGYPTEQRFIDIFDAFDIAAHLIKRLGHAPVSPAAMDRLYEGWEKYPPESAVFDRHDMLRFISRDLEANLAGDFFVDVGDRAEIDRG